MPRNFAASATTARFAAAVALLLAALCQPVAAATCSASSGPVRATVIELYTSEGCSSCPPADRWLSGFVRSPAAPPVVALAFHVDYWDQLGWRDRFASPAFTARQQARGRSNHGRFVYTPQTLVDGRDSNRWREADGPGRLPGRTASDAGARLKLDLESGEESAPGRFTATLEATPLDTGQDPVVAWIALYENGLSSQVNAGENAGRRLQHDFVVREWRGPFPVGRDDTTRITVRFGRDDLRVANTGVAAIVERRDGASILQAVARPACTGP